jgi:hypothetical protein
MAHPPILPRPEGLRPWAASTFPHPGLQTGAGLYRRRVIFLIHRLIPRYVILPILGE